MLSKKMMEINEKYQIAKMDKKEAVKLLRKDNFPAWTQRQSDLPTWVCLEEAKNLGYKPQTVEPYRETNGSIQVTFDGRYWHTDAVVTDAYKATEEGKICLEDMDALTKAGNTYINVSNVSSERRHCVALAKALSVLYKLAFVETKDVQAVDPKSLQNKERRVEIYKFGTKMGPAPSEEKKEEKKKDDKKGDKKEDKKEEPKTDTPPQDGKLNAKEPEEKIKKDR